MSTLKGLKQELGIHQLLSAEDANPKAAKSGKLGIRTAVLHLAPAKLSGYEVCPMRSDGCTKACLHTAGNPVYMDAKEKSRKHKTKMFFERREPFMNLLVYELHRFRLKAEKDNYEFAARLNATSDIRWESVKFGLEDWVAKKIGYQGDLDGLTIFDIFPKDQFYDYTKIANRKRVPSNYYLTFSLNEDNEKHAKGVLASGRNVAVVFSGELPNTYLGYPVIDGDEHDYRPQDPRPTVVGLKAKGAAKVDETGFVI